MRRRQLFEFNDWIKTPEAVREGIVESLSLGIRYGGFLRTLVAPFQRFLATTGATEVLELCSGAAGPAQILVREMLRQGASPPRFLLTDLFPHEETYQALKEQLPDHLDYVAGPVDATNVEESVSQGRPRLIINAFHHFPEELARGILADAVKSGQGIFLVEAFERNPLLLFPMTPGLLAGMLAMPVKTRSHRIVKGLLTYVLPVMLSLGLWDGLVSTMRVYSEKELRAMAEPLSDDWRWTYGNYRFGMGGRGYYFYGNPIG